MTDTIETCRARVAGAVRDCTPEQIDAIAAHHFLTGESVWHSVHVALNTPRCNCVACRRVDHDAPQRDPRRADQ